MSLFKHPRVAVIILIMDFVVLMPKRHKVSEDVAHWVFKADDNMSEEMEKHKSKHGKYLE